MFGINFTRNGQPDCTEVEARIDANLPVEKCILHFSWETGHQYTAVLLARHLGKELGAAIQTAHRNGYEQGWRDAKSKKRKKKGFLFWFPKSRRDGGVLKAKRQVNK